MQDFDVPPTPSPLRVTDGHVRSRAEKGSPPVTSAAPADDLGAGDPFRSVRCGRKVDGRRRNLTAQVDQNPTICRQSPLTDSNRRPLPYHGSTAWATVGTGG